MFERLRYGKQYGYEVLFKRQPKQPAGKPGVIIAEMGMPEEYEFEFYNHFMQHVFSYVLPPFIKPLVLADRGVGLIDPDHPLAREPFKPTCLVDAYGSETNRAGVRYLDCPVQWIKPNKKNPWDHGYFLYKGDGPNGAPDVCDKVGAKIVGWYYGRLLPEKKVPMRSQMRKVYEEAVQELSRRCLEAEFRSAYYMRPQTIQAAVEELLAAGCQTIIYQSTNCPVYCDFEDYGYALPMLHDFVNGRAPVIMADQLGNQPATREAFLAMLRDLLKEIPASASVWLILSRHGHPFKKETQDTRAPLYLEPIAAGAREILQQRGGKWELSFSCDEYADDYWDPKRTKVDTHDIYQKAIEQGYDYAIELPIEFLAENTDLMFFHAMKKFNAFPDYDCNNPVPYPDWDQPLRRFFHAGKTTGIYAGTPVGPYRKYIVQAVVDSIQQVLG
jgi:protoheme ferro-lyase